MTDTTFETEFSREIWTSTYKDSTDDTVDDTMMRVARHVAQAEKNQSLRDYWQLKFYDMLTGFKVTAGGRIYSNAGADWMGTTLMNCFAAPRDSSDIDSLNGILTNLSNQANTLKSEGGWGDNFSYIRPRGSFIHGIGVESPGAVKYMELFDRASDIITSGSGKNPSNKKTKGKIRKGAMMGVLDCIAGDTLIDTIDGRIPVKDLVGKNPYLYCTDGYGRVYVRQAELVWSKGIRNTIKVILDTHDVIECTPDHEVMLSDGTFKKAKDLTTGDSLAALHRVMYNNKYIYIGVSGSGTTLPEHHAVYEMKYGTYPTYTGKNRTGDMTIVHHIDECKWNNHPSNIESTVLSEHGKLHYDDGYSNQFGENFNHKVVRIEESIEQEVFDISMPDYHNYSANGVFIHNCWHPDIIEFITAKQSAGRLSKFNISVNLTDDFMEKIIKIEEMVANDSSEDEIDLIDQWQLRFPDTTHIAYKTEWDGDLSLWLSKCYPVTVFETTSAMKIWNLIMDSTYNRAEPGVLFLDRANAFYPSNYIDKIFTTNPCGEQTLPPAGVCDLGSINLTAYVIENKKGELAFDFDSFTEIIPTVVRFLDNINSVSNASLPEYEDSMKNKRRIGVGILGWGSLLFMMKIRLGSDDANILREYIMGCLARESYKSSIDLAIEKGMFKYCVPVKHARGKFVEHLGLSKAYMNKLADTGIRNSSVLSIQPTGNTSIFANILSGGIEPIFMPEYIRTVIQGVVPDNMIDVTPKWYEGQWFETDMFKFTKEGDEEILKGVDETTGITYKIDKNRGLTKEVLCEDYAVRWLKARGEWDPKADWAVTTMDLTADAHIDDLRGFARWVDSSISKCVVKGTPISTTKGILKIEDFTQSFNDVDTFNDVDYDISVLDESGELQKVISHYYGGKQQSYGIMFSNGKRIKCASTHKIKTESGFKCPSELTIGESVFYNTTEIQTVCDYQKLDIVDVSDFHYHAEFTFPAYYTESFALFLGMWLCDGVVNVNSVAIVEKNDAVGELVDSLFIELFGIPAKISIDNKTGVKTHYINSRPLVLYFKNIFGSDCVTKRIPEGILKSPKSVQIELLRGLTLDGYKTNNRLVIYEGYSENIVDGIVSIVSSMGKHYYKGVKAITGGRKSNIIYSCSVWGMNLDLIASHKFNNRDKGGVRRYVNPLEIDSIIEKIGTGIKEREYRRNFKNSLKQSNFVGEDFLDKINVKYDNNISNVKIVSVDDIGIQEVYDIEVENTHTYQLDGIVSHNTVNIPNDYPYEDFKNIYLDSYKSGWIKGVTTYRSGTMSAVLSTKEDETTEEEIILDDVKLPDSAPAVMKTIRAEGKKWYLTIVYHENNNRPFALFVKTNARETSVRTNNAIELLMQLVKAKGIKQCHIDDVVNKINTDDNASKITRIISFLLRHGVLIKNIVCTLDKIEDVYAGSFIFQIKKFLQTYIKEGDKVEGVVCDGCGSDQIVYSEGCFKCNQCGSSKCS